MGYASDRRIGSFFFEGVGFSLGGDVVMEVGPDGLLIIELIDNLPCLLYGLDDKFNLIV